MSRTRQKTVPGAARASKPRASPQDLVQKALALLDRRIEDERVNLSISDLVRLLELAKEWEQEKPRPVMAGWVDPDWMTKEN